MLNFRCWAGARNTEKGFNALFFTRFPHFEWTSVVNEQCELKFLWRTLNTSIVCFGFRLLSIVVCIYWTIFTFFTHVMPIRRIVHFTVTPFDCSFEWRMKKITFCYDIFPLSLFSVFKWPLIHSYKDLKDMLMCVFVMMLWHLIEFGCFHISGDILKFNKIKTKLEKCTSFSI